MLVLNKPLFVITRLPRDCGLFESPYFCHPQVCATSGGGGGADSTCFAQVKFVSNSDEVMQYYKDDVGIVCEVAVVQKDTKAS